MIYQISGGCSILNSLIPTKHFQVGLYLINPIKQQRIGFVAHEWVATYYLSFCLSFYLAIIYSYIFILSNYLFIYVYAGSIMVNITFKAYQIPIFYLSYVGDN